MTIKKLSDNEFTQWNEYVEDNKHASIYRLLEW